ncbi:MAG: hypothetical protein ACYC0T_12800 [Ramlibacter sp.]
MTAFPSTARVAANLAIALVLAPASACWAQAGARLKPKVDQEIAPFRLTGVDGYVQVRSLTDDSLYSQQSGSAGSHARQSNLIEEVLLLTHSYVYHPSLLSLDLGGGPVLDRSRYELNGERTDANRRMYNLQALATVLRDKPYTGQLFFGRHNQTQNLGPALEILTENTRYGASLSLRNPVTPMPLKLDLTRSDNRGRGGQYVIDDRIDQAHFTTSANIGKSGGSNFQYMGTRQHSVSGSTGLPIQISRFHGNSAQLNTRLKLGALNQYDFANTIALNTNDYTVGQALPTQLRDFDFGVDLRGQHASDSQTYARYNFSSGRRDQDSMRSNSASAGITHDFNPHLSGTLAARGESNRASHLSFALYAIDGSAQYRRPLPLGQATLDCSFSYSRRDQHATALQSRLLGERLTLTGTTLVTLGKPQIVAGTVVVSNLTRTQRFVEGRDYVLSQIGLDLRIQRLLGGNILDGQEVLIDYDFALGGSYRASQFDSAVGASWAYKSYLSMFARYTASAPRIDSGAPTSPLNQARTTLFGLRAEVPLSLPWWPLLLGGNAERENRRETILPYQRSSHETYAQVDLPLVDTGNIRIGSRRMQVDYDNNPAQGVNLQAYDLRLWSRLPYGIDLSVDGSRERDSGTPVLRERSFTSVKAQWRQRKLLWTFSLTRTHDVQGPTERRRTYGQMSLRRDF